jgi:hypothetical protein
MEEFKFPDELEEEAKSKVEVKVENDDIEIEIEDDTPPQDRNKEPLPKEVKEELYNDELEDYSSKVKKKILQMKKLANDERRDKERAVREQQEALTLAQQVIEENKRLKSSQVENERQILASIQKSVELEMESAKRAYRDAYDSGDPERLLDAQTRLNEASIKIDKVKNYRPTPLQTEDHEVKIQQRMQQQVPNLPRPDPTAVNWQQQNSWFGEDKLMTGMALALHEQLKEEGVAVSSKEYYRRIDETMRKRFPERFEADSDEQDSKSESSTKKPSTVVAPATRSTSSKKVRLTQSQLSISKKLGLTPEQYVREVLKMEAR